MPAPDMAGVGRPEPPFCMGWKPWLAIGGNPWLPAEPSREGGPGASIEKSIMDASPGDFAWDVLIAPEWMLRPAKGCDGCCGLLLTELEVGAENNPAELPFAAGVGVEKKSSSMGAADEECAAALVAAAGPAGADEIREFPFC